MNRQTGNLTRAFSFIVVNLALGAAWAQTVHFVDDDAPFGGSGTSWTDAFDDLQDALGAASAGDQIWVAGGTYRPAEPGSQPGASFQLLNGVVLCGGYAGLADPGNPNQRDIELYQTILSGDLNGDDDSGGDSRDNCYHVVTGTGTDATAALDGFTVTGGNSTGPGQSGSGGGVYVGSGSPTLTDCTFVENFSANGGGGMYNGAGSPTLTRCTFSDNSTGDHPASGGGLHNGGGSPTLIDCTFERNSAVFGGGMFNFHGTPLLIDCTFCRNTVTGSGGGMYDYADHPGHDGATLLDCDFDRNSAEGSGGGIRNWCSRPTLVGCTFHGNSADLRGGGMANDEHGDALLTGCTFESNWSAGTGGGMVNGASSPELINCIFLGNHADSFFAHYIVYGGAVSNYDGSSATLTNCAFVANVATGWPGHAGGMYNERSSPTLTNCTFNVNRSGTVGGMYNYDYSTPTLTNCILWDVGGEVWDDAGSVASIAYSDVQGGWPGTGNINEDPLLDELWLSPGSPCINAADPAFVPPPGATDVDGHARLLCGRVDMGADEFGIGDYTCDQTVDLDDFVYWGECMTGPHSGPYDPGCEAFDFELDGDVDLHDFGRFQAIYAES